MLPDELLLFAVLSWQAVTHLSSYGSRWSQTYRQLGSTEQSYWCYSVTSTVHAVVISALCVSALLEEPDVSPFTLGGPFYTTTAASNQLLQIFFGYILSDTVGCLWYNRRWPGWQANLIHHATAGLIALLFLVAELGHSLGIAAILLEVTTPLVNARWFLDTCGLRGSTLYLANGIAMTLLWLIVRVLGGAGIGVMLAYQWHEVPRSLQPRQQPYFLTRAAASRRSRKSLPPSRRASPLPTWWATACRSSGSRRSRRGQ